MIQNNTVSFCVPITARNEEELKETLDKVIANGINLVEYRRDYLQNDKQENTIYKLLYDNICKVEIIFTFRDYKEGGQTVINDEDRFNSIVKALNANCFNYLDIEEAVTEKFLKTVDPEKLKDIKLIVSAHDFHGTPDKKTILNQLLRSNEVADIVKAAYTVNSENDLQNLIWAAKRFKEQSQKPLILIGMGELGQKSRIFPEILCSNLSFTPLEVESGSAPGQLDFKTIQNLRESFMRKKRHVYLTGLMGSGKTTIGKLVAQRLGRPFIDLDKEIEKKENRSINEIFDQDGEEYFRKIETEILESLDPNRYMVVATGGGIILKDINRELMKEKGNIIYLNVPIEKLANRLNDDYERPLLKNNEKETKLIELNEQRQPLYRDGSYELNTGNLTPLQAAKEIVEVVK